MTGGDDIFIQLFGYIILAVIYAFIEWRKNQEKTKQPSRNLAKTVERSETIRNILEFLKDKFDAYRITITQYHNGGKYYTGEDMQRMTMTFDVYVHNARSVKREYDYRLLVEEDHEVIRILLKYGIYRIDSVDSMEETEFYHSLKAQSTKSYYAFLFRDNKNLPIGVLSMFFLEENGLTTTDIVEVKGKVIEIQNLLLHG